MDKDNKKQNTPPKQSDRAGAGGGNFEKRSNEPLKKNYRNHNQEHILPPESRLEQMFGDDYKKDRKWLLFKSIYFIEVARIRFMINIILLRLI